MNIRRYLLAALAFCSLGVASAKELPLEKRIYTDAKGKTIPYRLLKPEPYDAQATYPLVLFLHGAGERGTDNDKQLVHGVPEFASEENRKKYPCFLVAPQCPANTKWVDVDWGADSHEQPKEMTEPMRLTLELLGALQKELRIDPKRIYVTGLSMGGYGAWDIVTRRPEMFAATVPVCGGADEKQAAAMAKLPVWAFHGAKDTAVKPARSRNMIAALKKAGGKPRYTEYPNVGHNSWGPAYKDTEMFQWLFAQKRE